jgi:hypothetical protein
MHIGITRIINNMKRINHLIIAALLINIASCQTKKKMEKFYWLPTECSPELYPTNIATGFLYYEDGGKIYIPSASYITNGWGKDGSTDVVGDDYKPVPIRLDITWISFTENKFFSGSFTLPKDSMTKLFKEGYIYSGTEKHDTYNTIIIGMAPGGIVVVWMMGAGHQVEIGRYQAKESNMTMEEYISLNGYSTDMTHDRSEFVKLSLQGDTAVLKNLKTKGLQLGLWDKYRERFNIKPVIIYYDSDVRTTDELYTSYFNGEQNDMLSEEFDKTNDYSLRARVRTMGISWKSNWANKETQYWAEIYFKEDEIFKAYQEIYGDDKTQPVELIVHVNMNNDSLRIYLKSKTKQVELLQSKDEIYLDPDNKHNYPTVRYDQVNNDQ